MKTTHSPSLLWPAIGYVAMILTAATMSLSATTHTWICDSGIWSASSDWSTGSIPVSEDSLIFTGDNTYTYNDLTSTITLRHITFDANASGHSKWRAMPSTSGERSPTTVTMR